MKRMFCVLVTLVTFAVASPLAAQSCIWTTCQYQTDGGFNNGGLYWDESASTTYPTATACGTSTVAQLDGGEYVRQTFNTGTHTVWEIDFRAYLLNDTNDFYDELKVRITNNDTGQSEFVVLRGSSYTTNCNLNFQQLDNDYNDASVTIEFKSGPFSQGTWQIDDVVFAGTSY